MKNLIIYTFFFTLLLGACKSKKDIVQATSTNTEEIIVNEPPTPKANFRPGMGGGNIDDIIAQLGLSEEKAASFKAIADEYQKKRMVLKGQAKDNPQGMVEKMRNMRDAQEEDVKGLLSKKEWTKYKEIISSQVRNRKPNGGGGIEGPKGGK